MVVAFAPITMVAAGGGVLAVMHLNSRAATGDLDFLLDPEWAFDDDIRSPLNEAIQKVARNLVFNKQWANEDMAVLVTSSARRLLFTEAEKQNVVLFDGKNIRVLAAPIEWALERIRKLNANGFDIVPDDTAMERVAEEYRKRYGEDIF